MAILNSTTANITERFAALQVLLEDRKNHAEVYKFLLNDQARTALINEPKNWSGFYRKFIEQIAPNYKIASSQIGGHFFRFAATNGTTELRVQSMKAWFDLGADFGDLSQVHQVNLSVNSRLNEEESKSYLASTKRILKENILNKAK